jgi:uncharacterized protein YndB with AHSA1/START domain
MPVVDVKTDIDALTLTIVADFAAPVERVWQIYADPRQLERVWGPPQYPATFVDHELSPGGRMNYYMTSPEGEKFCGYWRITEVSEPDFFAFADGFADEQFNPNTDLPESQNVYSFAPHEGGTRATFVATYPSAEGLQQVLDMGMIEGATAAIGQIDELLAA